MKDALILEHKTYISAKRAAEITGYTSDYVGQLSRSGKIDSKIVGRGWFVLEESLLKHKLINDEVKTNKKTAWKRRKFQKIQQSQIAREEIRHEKKLVENNQIFGTFLLTEKAESLSPKIISQPRVAEIKPVTSPFDLSDHCEPSYSFAQEKRVEDEERKEKKESKIRFVPAHFSMRGMNFAAQGISGKIGDGIYFSSHKTISQPTNFTGNFSTNFAVVALLLVAIGTGGFFVQSILVGTSQRNNLASQQASIISVAGDIFQSAIRGFEAITGSLAADLGFGKKQALAVAPPNAPAPAQNVSDQDLGFNGIAVTPSTNNPTKDELIKERIRDSFSDEVQVHPDQSGTAGIITPVFKKATSDNFVYVLVPVNEPGASANNQSAK